LPRLETVALGKPARFAVVRSYTATIEAFEKAELCAMVKGVADFVPDELTVGRAIKKDEPLLTLAVPDLVAERDNRTALVEQSQGAEELAVQAVDVADAEVKEYQELMQRDVAEFDYRKAQHVRISRLAKGDTLTQQAEEEAALKLHAAKAALATSQAQIVTKQ